MLKIIQGDEAVDHPDLLDALFRARYETFVKRRNWPLPCRADLDIDQYDDGSATYFIMLDDDGHRILASSRINQTVRSSLLADLFPHLIESGDAPRAPTLYEGTRFMLDPSLATHERRREMRALLCTAICRWILDQGGTHLQAVVELSGFQSFLEMSLRTRAMGLPHDYGGGPKVAGGGRCIAFRWELTSDLLADFEAYGRGEIAPELTLVH